MSEDKNQEGKLYQEVKKLLQELPELNPQAANTALLYQTKVFITLNEAKADFPFTIWQDNPDSVTYFPKVPQGADPDKYLSLGTGFLENAEALQKIAEWYLKWFGSADSANNDEKENKP